VEDIAAVYDMIETYVESLDHEDVTEEVLVQMVAVQTVIVNIISVIVNETLTAVEMTNALEVFAQVTQGIGMIHILRQQLIGCVCILIFDWLCVYFDWFRVCFGWLFRTIRYQGLVVRVCILDWFRVYFDWLCVYFD